MSLRAICLCLPLLFAAACEETAGTVPSQNSSTPERMPTARDGAALYKTYCQACHGVDGKGDGPMARANTRAPKDLTLIAVRNGDSFPRARVMSIVDGYARSDMSGPGMPEFGELLSGDLVPFDSGDGRMTPTPRKLVALVEYLETIQVRR